MIFAPWDLFPRAQSQKYGKEIKPSVALSITCKYRRKIGNKANHSTAKDKRLKTSKLVSKREARRTDAKMAAFVDSDPGILCKSEN